MININEEQAAAEGNIGEGKFTKNTKNGQCYIRFSKDLKNVVSSKFQNGTEMVGIFVEGLGILFVEKGQVSQNISLKSHRTKSKPIFKDDDSSPSGIRGIS